MSDDPQLDELRALFREEALDAVRGLGRVAVALDDPAARARAAQEAFRIVHGVKGAARAAQVPELERALHELESELARLREASYADVGRVRAAVDAATARIGGWLGAADVVRAAAQGEASAPPPRDAGALRVRGDVVLGLLAASEEALAAASEVDAEAHATDDGGLAEARSLVGRLAALLEDPAAERDELRGAVGRVARAVHAIGFAQRVGEARRRRAARGARDASSEVVRLARGLGATSLDELAPPLTAAGRAAAEELGKEVDVSCQLASVILDRRIVDGLREPLLHLVRNAADHGVETPAERRASGKPPRASIHLSAEIRGGEAHVVVRDDGRGFDVEALRRAAEQAGVDSAALRADSALDLAFLPGVTTRSDVTSLSGRGVGLDAVRDRVARLHGRLQVETELGRGATVRIVVPTDLSVLRAVVVGSGGTRFAVASANVHRLGRASWDEVATLEGRTYVRSGEALVPLVDLADALALERSTLDGGAARWPFVVIAAGERSVAVRVDELFDERELVVRPLGSRVRRAAFVAGAVPGERGEVMLLLDAADLASARPGLRPEADAPRRRRRVLVVDDSLTTRQLERAMLEAAGYDVRVAEDGARAWLLLESERFDLVVSDIEMPAVDGFQLLGRIRASATLGTTPVVLVTALADDADRRRALELGANAYVLKSRFDQEELLELLARLA